MTPQRIKLYQGSVTECSYLDNRQAVNIYADPHHPHPRDVYNQLIKRGFRRSGEYIYRPGCNDCTACTPIRILAQDFRLRRTDKRNLSRNDDLQLELTDAAYSDEHFKLYERYLSVRHPEGGMDNPTPDDFTRFLLNPWGETLFLSITLHERLIAVAVTDATGDGLSAVYTFFDPDFASRGLGRFCILQQIQLCNRLGYPHLYLGYWVDGCQKMQYKTNYQPQEHFNGHEWKTFETPT